jgi:hypothetical protein
MKPKNESAEVFDIETYRLTPEEVVELAAKQKEPDAAAMAPKRKRRQRDERFVLITETAISGFVALGCPAAVVWAEILFRAWKDKTTTIKLPNQALADMGVSRWAKYRALNRLARAGWIQVERTPRKSVQVTLLKPGCVRF